MGKMCFGSVVAFLPCLFCGFILILSFYLCEFLGNYFTSVCNLWKPERKPRRAHVMEFRPDAETDADPDHSDVVDSGHTCTRASTSTCRTSTAPSLDQLDAPPSYETCFPLHRSLHEMNEEVQPICCRLCKRRSNS